MQPVLSVCLGNLCRSPAALPMCAPRARAPGLPQRRAGAGDGHAEEPSCPPMIAAMRSDGHALGARR